MTLIRITDQLEFGKILVNFRYDPDAVALIKDVVPSHARSWEAATKTWRVDYPMKAVLESAFQSAGHEVVHGDGPAPVVVATLVDFFKAESDEYDAKAKASAILSDIPAQHQGKVFRAMAKQLYPDLYRGR